MRPPKSIALAEALAAKEPPRLPRRTKVVSCRVSPVEKGILEAYADVLGTSVNRLLRQAGVDQLLKNARKLSTVAKGLESDGLTPEEVPE